MRAHASPFCFRVRCHSQPRLGNFLHSSFQHVGGSTLGLLEALPCLETTAPQRPVSTLTVKFGGRLQAQLKEHLLRQNKATKQQKGELDKD